MSGNSWANMGQECIKCHINVYPNKQARIIPYDLSNNLNYIQVPILASTRKA